MRPKLLIAAFVVGVLVSIALSMSGAHIYGCTRHTLNCGVVIASEGFEFYPVPGHFHEEA